MKMQIHPYTMYGSSNAATHKRTAMLKYQQAWKQTNLQDAVTSLKKDDEWQHWNFLKKKKIIIPTSRKRDLLKNNIDIRIKVITPIILVQV